MPHILFLHVLNCSMYTILLPTLVSVLCIVRRSQMGLIESFRFLAKSKYLGHIALIVLSYGLSMEFTEIIWKAIVKLKHPDKTNYMAFMGQYSQVL
jgi:ATP/ADP translocase